MPIDWTFSLTVTSWHLGQASQVQCGLLATVSTRRIVVLIGCLHSSCQPWKCRIHIMTQMVVHTIISAKPIVPRPRRLRPRPHRLHHHLHRHLRHRLPRRCRHSRHHPHHLRRRLHRHHSRIIRPPHQLVPHRLLLRRHCHRHPTLHHPLRHRRPFRLRLHPLQPRHPYPRQGPIITVIHTKILGHTKKTPTTPWRVLTLLPLPWS